MSVVDEGRVKSALLSYKGSSGRIKVGAATIEVQLEPQDNRVGDSPDFFLWVTLNVRVFEHDARIRVPILVEAEASGLDSALEDLQKFVVRGRHPLDIPMLVVAASGYRTEERTSSVPAKITIHQLPLRRIP